MPCLRLSHGSTAPAVPAHWLLHLGSSTMLGTQLSMCSCVRVPSEQRCSLLPALQWPGDKQAAVCARTRASPKLLLTSAFPAWPWHPAHSRSLKELWAVQPTCPGPMPAPATSLPACSKLGSCSCPAFPWHFLISTGLQGPCSFQTCLLLLPAPGNGACPSCLREAGTPRALTLGRGQTRAIPQD